MAITDFNVVMKAGLAIAMISGLAGCGLTQTVAEGTASATHALFYKQVRVMHLDFSARGAVNNNQRGVPLSTVVRVYQLRDRKAFDTADYRTLLAGDSLQINADLLVQRDVRVMPDGSVSLDIPLEKEANYVAIMALFWSPEIEQNTWRVVLERDDLDPDKPRHIELNDNRLVLQPLDRE